MRTVLGSLLVLAVGTGVGCGKDSGGVAVDAGGGPEDAGEIADAFVPPTGFTKLIGGSWSLQPGALDTYRCVRLTIPEDTYITNILAEAPFGTHHTVLSISDGGTAGPDGEYPCSVTELGMVMLYASGVGTSPLDFPPDVSVKIAAGTQLHLNLHLFNATDAPISGHTAIHVKAQPTPTPTLAEMVFAGTFGIVLPPSTQPQDVRGGCTADREFTLFALWPHMHQLGKHSKFELIRGGSTTVLHDAAFAFGEQYYFRQDPEVPIQTGDELRVTCTYLNDTGHTVTFGESSNQEMCFTGMYRYPAAGDDIFDCAR